MACGKAVEKLWKTQTAISGIRLAIAYASTCGKAVDNLWITCAKLQNDNPLTG
jgi:hypothetical protein